MIVDMHTHSFPQKIAASTIEKLSQMSHTRPFTDGTEDGLMSSMKAAGVDISVVLPVATAQRQVEHINDRAAEINRRFTVSGKRGLLSFGCMHPDYEGWREELGRIKDLGILGIKIHPVYQGRDLTDSRYLRILDRAGELGLIVVTHAGLDVGFPGIERCSPKMARRAIEQVGPVKLILAHMGGWRSWEQVMEELPGTKVRIDTSFSVGEMSQREGEEYYSPDELRLLDEARFMEMVAAFGAQRVFFGSDSPWSGQGESRRWIEALPLSQAEQGLILGGNAQKLLGL